MRVRGGWYPTGKRTRWYQLPPSHPLQPRDGRILEAVRE